MEKRFKIVADDRIPFLRGVLDDIAEMVYLPGSKTGREDVADADALITRTRTICSKDLLSGSRVKFIATATIGFDHINIADVADLGISWTNAPGCNAASVAQYIASALVSFPGSRQGQVLGIIGVGNVGKQVEKAAQALGMKVLLNDPPRAEKEGPEAFVSLDEIREKADFITLHVPLERAGKYPTFQMLDERFFSGVKKTAVFFNSSRGEAVNTADLKAALKNGSLAGAVLDVWENEPDIDLELLKLSCFATPHIAGYSTDGKANGTAMSVRSVCRHLQIDGFEEWFPADIPLPQSGTRIVLEEKYSPAAQVRQAVLHTYNIADDDWALRSAPEQFEKLRGSYRVRREFGAFCISGGSPEARNILKKLGFLLEGE